MTEKKMAQTEGAWLGGLASMCATMCTHPLDTVKVQLQTQKEAKLGFYGMTKHMIKTNGFMSTYNGLSAALLRQGTYSTVRFAFYEIAKDTLVRRSSNGKISFSEKIVIASAAGAAGSLFGSPFDLINVRMQNDSKLPLAERRNYKHSLEAFWRIARTEGFLKLYVGFHMATLRGAVVTVGQLAVYDQLKTWLITEHNFSDNVGTHFTSAMGAGFVATFITMPIDVLKTLLMNAKPGELEGLVHVTREVAKFGVPGFFKGFWPRYIRLGPFTLLTFIFYEQFKILSRKLPF